MADDAVADNRALSRTTSPVDTATPTTRVDVAMGGHDSALPDVGIDVGWRQ
jgi:hypothetical protein